MFRPDAVYSRKALDRMLGDIVETDRFLQRLGVLVRFKNAVLGADILRAMEQRRDEQRELAEIAGHPHGGSAVDGILGASRLPRNRRRASTSGVRPLTKADVMPEES
ncbi:MAG: hypothetical protein NTW86_30055 [Candidatus Sumerlaeota bacterium]|nr:hypothetical protein [Candidatus Sumerlaeota bacterium]